jgi:phage FluMu protein Com
MRKLIELHQENLIQCDNKSCDYVVKNQTGDANADISAYLNTACPKCGENLLTETDYLQSLKFMKGVNFMNKWFSWLTIFSPTKKAETKQMIHIHNGVKFYEE